LDRHLVWSIPLDRLRQLRRAAAVHAEGRIPVARAGGREQRDGREGMKKGSGKVSVRTQHGTWEANEEKEIQ